MRSIGLLPMKARTELVPRMNISAMIGDAIMTERPMSRAGRARFAGENRDVFKSAKCAD